MPPQASILIPLRNAEAFIGPTLDSLRCDGIELELIVIDDGSTDRSRELIAARADPRIRIVAGPGRGISAALNVGLAAVRAPIVMRCDADDLYPPDRIAQQLSWLAAHPEHGAVCGGFSAIDWLGRPVAQLPTGAEPMEITQELRSGRTRTHLCAFAIRSEVARAIGGFREFFVTGEDIDFQLRLASRAAVMYLPGDCYLYRLHEASITHQQSRERRLQYERLARVLNEQRQREGADDLDRGKIPHLDGSEYGKPDTAADQMLGYITGSAWAAHAQGQKARALAVGLRALRYRRWDPRVWRNLATLLLKPTPASAPSTGAHGAPQRWPAGAPQSPRHS
jgi:glycosyltransferase involved in cell wall biosynthesis